MGDLMSTGLSGLLAYRRALDTAGHNIANAGTDGYSRQRVEFATLEPTPQGNGFIGNGVRVVSVRRSYDDFLTGQMRGSASSFERMQALATQAERINSLFSDGANGLAASLQRFANALQGAASSPTSLAARQVLIGESRTLVDRLQGYEARLQDIENDVNGRLRVEINEVSGLASGIAQLNDRIQRGMATTGQPPNDLLDQRDRLLDQLAARMNVQVVDQDGQYNVFVGRGQALVLGSTANEVVASTDSFDSARPTIALKNAQNTVDVTSAINGGSIGGLLEFRTQILDPARSKLGRIAVGLAEEMNAQHRAGMDLRGALGGDFFTVGAPIAQRALANSGAATLDVAIEDVNALTGADYLFEFTGTGYQLRDATTNLAVPMTGSGTLADPFRAAGISIAVNGSMAAGDKFAVRPTRAAITGLSALIQDPAAIAIAVPIKTAADNGNTGSGSISKGIVLDPADPQLRNAVTIEFLSATTYSVNGAGSFPYTPGAPITLNGWQVEISGTPASGDRFSITDNVNGTGDNRNGQLLADAMNRRNLAQGSASVVSSAATLVGDIGVTTRQVQTGRDIQQALHQENVSAKQDAAGVNLDEEAAQLLRFQQAYQAMAQIIRTANLMFDALLSATR